MGEHFDNFKKKGDESLQKKIVFFVVDNFVPKSRSNLSRMLMKMQ